MPLCLQRAKVVQGCLAVCLSGVEDHRWEVWAVGGIREVLCFEAYGGASWEGGAMLSAVAVRPVVGVHLYSGFCCPAFHSAAALRVSDTYCEGQFPYLSLIEDEAVVVSCAVAYLFVVGVDVTSDSLWCSEVEGCPFYL